MNKILCLFDEQYVIDMFSKKVLPLYPDFASVKNINIYAYKENIWEKTYHVVIKFNTTFLTKTHKIAKLPIICSAHSDEPRKNVYTALKFLWKHGFGSGYLTIPHPLFYSNYFSAIFYRGVDGNNLYYYIKNNDLKAIKNIIPKTAGWFAKLHNLPTKEAINFNKKNSRIATVFPGVNHILERIKEKYPQYLKIFKNGYDEAIAREQKFLSSTKQRWLTHGDAHPENIIKMGKKKIAVIDFTDLCLSDFTRDLGSFLQQLEFMCNRKINDQKYADKIKNIFLDCYFKERRLKPDKDIQERIDNYYNWTAMRTATFFLLKHGAEPERAKLIIKKLKS